jgi:hypothetical protein
MDTFDSAIPLPTSSNKFLGDLSFFFFWKLQPLGQAPQFLKRVFSFHLRVLVLHWFVLWWSRQIKLANFGSNIHHRTLDHFHQTFCLAFFLCY